MREREEEKMRLQHESLIAALEKVDADLAEFYDVEGIEKDEEYYAGREQREAAIALEKKRGPRKPRY